MVTVIMTYEAKCKHCIHFKYGSVTKKDGTISKKMVASCTNKDSEMFNSTLTLKSKACNKLEL